LEKYLNTKIKTGVWCFIYFKIPFYEYLLQHRLIDKYTTENEMDRLAILKK